MAELKGMPGRQKDRPQPRTAAPSRPFGSAMSTRRLPLAVFDGILSDLDRVNAGGPH